MVQAQAQARQQAAAAVAAQQAQAQQVRTAVKLCTKCSALFDVEAVACLCCSMHGNGKMSEVVWTCILMSAATHLAGCCSGEMSMLLHQHCCHTIASA
jgi:ribosomal protein L40E